MTGPAGGRHQARAFGDDGLRHDLIEIGAQLQAAVARERRTRPRRERGVPRAFEIAVAARARDEPVGRDSGRGVPAQLVLHPGDDARVERRAFRFRPHVRLPIDGAGPPVEDALVRRTGCFNAIERPLELHRGRARLIVQVQELAQRDDQLRLIGR